VSLRDRLLRAERSLGRPAVDPQVFSVFAAALDGIARRNAARADTPADADFLNLIGELHHASV